MILCSCCYILNNYYLYKSEIIDTEESKIIEKISKVIHGSITTNDIVKLKPIYFGRYIALIYIYIYEK